MVLDIDKMKALLLDEHAYRRISCNPTTHIEKQVSEAVFQQGLITDSVYKRINPQFSYPPQMYGLPKTNKANVPMRPIVAAVGSPMHELAKELVKILSPFLAKTSSFVKNSSDFANESGTSDIIVSFDFVSFFTIVLKHYKL